MNRLALPWAKRGGQRSPLLAAWAATASGGARLIFGLAGMLAVAALAWPVSQLDTGMPSITVVPQEDGSRQGFEQVARAFGPGRTGRVAGGGAGRARRARSRTRCASEPGIARVLPAQRGAGQSVLLQAIPVGEPSG